MVNFAPGPVIEGAPRVSLPYGLFSVLSPRPEGDRKWINGTTWVALTCAPASGIGEPECEPDEDGHTVAVGLPKTFDGLEIADASAFTIYGSFKCSPVGNVPADAQQRATTHLLAREEARTEQALWTGDLGNIPNLATGATTLTNTGGASQEALGRLEAWLGTHYGSLGVIHMSRAGAMSALADYSLDIVGGQLRTRLGTPVIAGAGYPGTGPNGASPSAGHEFAFASPALFGYRSDIETSSSRPGDLLDRGKNDMYAIAERQYLLGFDPCGTAGIQFALSPPV